MCSELNMRRSIQPDIGEDGCANGNLSALALRVDTLNARKMICAGLGDPALGC